MLSRYLNALKLWPTDGEQWEKNWITFPMRVHVFDKETTLKPLRELVADKTEHYAASRLGFDQLSLLIVYNRAWIYNSPAETPLHSFEDAAAELARIRLRDRGPFDRAFLFLAMEPGRVLPVW